MGFPDEIMILWNVVLHFYLMLKKLLNKYNSFEDNIFNNPGVR